MEAISRVVLNEPAVPAVIEPEFQLASDFAAASKSRNTLIAYKSDLRVFCSWCDARELTAIPATAETIASYVASEAAAGRRPSTISRRLAARASGVPFRPCRGRKNRS
jgi:Phage integrase, N-terminal SAM-like domain